MAEALDQILASKISRAEEYIHRFNGVVIALSAGVDSSLVALLAKRSLGGRVLAVTGVSESLASGELATAEETAREIGVRHQVVKTEELLNPAYASNSGDRCYHCKRTLYKELRRIAMDCDYEAILDGTQTDDLYDDRPGLRAATEAGIASPLLYAGFTKDEVREAARALGLSVWNKPAMPCLSSRIPKGQLVSTEKLSMIDRAESFVKSILPVTDLRVRHNNGTARIEVRPDQRHLFFNEEIMATIDRELREIGFSSVTLDLHGYATATKVDTTLTLPISK